MDNVVLTAPRSHTSDKSSLEVKKEKVIAMTEKVRLAVVVCLVHNSKFRGR